MKMEHIMHIQLASKSTAHLIAPIIEIAGDDERHIRRDSAPDMLDQNACLRPPAFGEQAKVDAQAMHALPIRQFNLAMQQPAAFKAMRGNINVQGLQDRKAAEYRVAMMPRLIHRVLAVGAMWPDFPRDEFVLRTVRIVVKTLRMARVLTLRFLQKNDVGIQLAQTVAQLVQHHTAVEMGEAFVGVVGGDFLGKHGGILPTMDAGGSPVAIEMARNT